MNRMNTTTMLRGWTVAAGLAALLCTSPASALESCEKDADCGASLSCHAGVCVPTKLICANDAGCAAWQYCDMTCPHQGGDDVIGIGGGSTGSGGSSGGSAGSGGGEVPPDAPGDKEEPSEGSGEASEGSAGSAGSDGGTDNEGGAADDGGEDEPGGAEVPDGRGMPNDAPTCPTDVGVCMPDLDKLQTAPACVPFCQAVVGCDAFGGGDSTAPGESISTDPDPEPGSGGGSDAPDGGSSGGEGTDPVPTPGDDDGKWDEVEGQSEQEACELMCSMWMQANIAMPQWNALSSCVSAHGSDCEKLDSECTDEADAFIEAAEEDPAFGLWLESSVAMSEDDRSAAGGGTGSSDGGGGTGAPNGGPDNGAEQGGSGGLSAGGGARSSAGNSSGCTANPSAPGQAGALGLLAALGLGIIATRRRLQR